ncbi:DoxX family membrane protein [Ornithinimicrobium sufpigmenti]|uniref:DoxX family membrane protein n=1 Tax=Ornithinimicrobium sufpigmenti TaxID=2508882 RepID=UPI00192DA578|nr:MULTISPECIES: DoxX family membrane protein [unclassified Ornithinimicrobium]
MSERTAPTRERDRAATAQDGHVTMQTDIVRSSFARGALAFLRIVVGWIFLWAFLDKLFGLGYSTPGERAWINGGSPTFGFLDNASGAFGGMFQAMAGAAPFFDWLFMAGLLGIGVAMVLGAGVKVAAVAGTLLVFMMYLASFPLGQEGQTNPITTSHWLEAAAMITVAATRAGDTFGLGTWWSRIVGDSWLR